MFDRQGRIICSICCELMRIVSVTTGQALFVCEACSNASVVRFPADRLQTEEAPAPA